MALVGTYTYEAGVDGQPVTAGVGGVVAVMGDAIFSTAAAVHGGLGIKLGATWSYVSYAAHALPTTVSVYMRRGPEIPTSRIACVNLENPLDQSTICSVSLKKTGEMLLTDASNMVLATTSLVTAPGDALRIDWQATTNGSTIHLEARFFTGANIEGTTADEILVANVTSAETNAFVQLVTYSTTTLMFDTLRVWDDVSAWPGPYVPTAPTITVWNGTSEVSGTLTVWSGASEVPLSSIEVL